METETVLSSLSNTIETLQTTEKDNAGSEDVENDGNFGQGSLNVNLDDHSTVVEHLCQTFPS